jgi:hypothetical protein
MKQIIKTTALCYLLLLAGTIAVSGQRQSGPGDKYTLLTMPYNMKPLTLFRGQIEVNGGYKFAVRSMKFNDVGKSVYMRDDGTGTVYHYYFTDLTYGVTSFMQVGFSTNILRHGEREVTTQVQTPGPGTTEKVTVNTLTEVKGLGDLFIFTTFRLPIRYRGFDFSATGGLYMPTSDYQPPKPESTVVTNTTTASSYTVNLHYNQTNGYGVPVYLLAGAVKVGYRKFTVEGDFTFRTPKEEGTNIRWETTLVDKKFTYNEKTYSYLLNNSYDLNVSLHYQATGWFDVFFNTNWQKANGGWTEYYGKKYENKETELLALEPGFELKISPSLTIGQMAGFPVSGINSDAPFYLLTTVRFNFFPYYR